MSVGTHSETAFGRVLKLDAESGASGFSGTAISVAHDSDRLSNVYTLDRTSRHHPWLRREKSRRPPGVRWLATAAVQAGLAPRRHRKPSGSSLGLGRLIVVGKGGGSKLPGKAAVASHRTPGAFDISAGRTLSMITGIYLYDGTLSTETITLDDLAFSNSLTVEHNTLAPGVIGHIARNRTINQTTYAATDRWLHYDQVGSVMCTSDAAGELASTFHPDAFGNMMASWQTGLWTDTYSARAGWHHNTKELDAETGLVYMYQRWYSPETGTFASAAPYPPMMEHQYGFAGNQPANEIDPRGELNGPWSCAGGPVFCSMVMSCIKSADANAAAGWACGAYADFMCSSVSTCLSTLFGLPAGGVVIDNSFGLNLHFSCLLATPMGFCKIDRVCVGGLPPIGCVDMVICKGII